MELSRQWAAIAATLGLTGGLLGFGDVAHGLIKSVVFGIVIAFLSNTLLSGVGEHAWRWMLGVAAFPSIINDTSGLRVPRLRSLTVNRIRNRCAVVQ